MLKDLPDHHDADLILKLYDLRREPVMRESRNRIFAEFMPVSADEVIAVYQAGHPLNAALRQTLGYWEMAFGMARHGIVHADYLAENCTEGLNLFARVEPFLPVLREKLSPSFARNAEWLVKNSTSAREVFQRMQARMQHARAAKAKA
jgi:hypothetical protein